MGGSVVAPLGRRRAASLAALLAGAMLAAASASLAMGKKGGVAVDPVCGMEVDEAGARARGNASDHGGRTYYFCNPGCRAAFEKAPGSYGAPPAAGRGAVSVDPVCGMDVDEAGARARGWTAEHGGKTYFFCNPACRDGFAKDPAAHLRNGKGVRGMPAGHGAGGR